MERPTSLIAESSSEAPVGRSNLFLHIPRTGGSSVWHSLVAARDPADCMVIDIYHISIAEFGSPIYSREALESVAHIDGPVCRLYHHHTAQDVRPFLPKGRLNISTVLRDPVDRLVSDLTHYRRQVTSGNLSDAHLEAILASWTPRFQAAILDTATRDISELALLAASEPAFQNYYVAFLSFLLGHPATVENPHPSLSRRLIDDLIDAARQNFTAVVSFADLAKGFDQVAEALLVPPGGLQHHLNASGESGHLPNSTRRALQDLYAADYEIVDRLLRRAI